MVYGEDDGRQIRTVAATNDDGLTAVGQMDKEEAFANMKEFERNLWIQLVASLLLLAGRFGVAGEFDRRGRGRFQGSKMSTAKSNEEIGRDRRGFIESERGVGNCAPSDGSGTIGPVDQAGDPVLELIGFRRNKEQ